MPFGEILVILFYKFVYVMLRLWFLADVNLRSRSLYAIARPSVCLSVTLVHPTQPVEIFENFFHLTIAQGL